jgi:hypothetical protein
MDADTQARIEAVAAVVAAIRRYYEVTDRRRLHTIRQILYDVWENRHHAPKDPNRPGWSREARAVFRETGRRGDVVYDHAVPVTIVANKLFATDLSDPEAVRAALDRYVVIRILSKAEDARLDEAGYNSRMPAGYDDPGSDFYGDPLARYRAVGIVFDEMEAPDAVPIPSPSSRPLAPRRVAETAPGEPRAIAGASRHRPGTDYGFRAGSDRASRVSFYARPQGATPAEFAQQFGPESPCFNMLTKAEEWGHVVMRFPEIDPINGAPTTRYVLVHRDDASVPENDEDADGPL